MSDAQRRIYSQAMRDASTTLRNADAIREGNAIHEAMEAHVKREREETAAEPDVLEYRVHTTHAGLAREWFSGPMDLHTATGVVWGSDDELVRTIEERTAAGQWVPLGAAREAERARLAKLIRPVLFNAMNYPNPNAVLGRSTAKLEKALLDALMS